MCLCLSECCLVSHCPWQSPSIYWTTQKGSHWKEMTTLQKSLTVLQGERSFYWPWLTQKHSVLQTSYVCILFLTCMVDICYYKLFPAYWLLSTNDYKYVCQYIHIHIYITLDQGYGRVHYLRLKLCISLGCKSSFLDDPSQVRLVFHCSFKVTLKQINYTVGWPVIKMYLSIFIKVYVSLQSLR